MTIPHRGETSQSTYFVTANAWEKMSIFQTDRMAGLLVDVLLDYRKRKKYQLHEFVVMPNHLHLLLSPAFDVTLEKSMQFIKGGFSFRAKKELGFDRDIWQTSFVDRRVRDLGECEKSLVYIRENPVKAGLCALPKDWKYGSASGLYELDPLPQRLKPSARATDMQA
jgi:putative transposase